MENHENKENNLIKHFIIKIIIWFIVDCLISLFVFLIEYFATERKLYVILTDSFTLSFVLSLCFYLLVLLKNSNAFSPLFYSIKLYFTSIFNKDKEKETYSEYKDKQGMKTNSLYLLIPTIPFFILMIVFLCLTL